MLYVGSIEGSGIFLAPKHIYSMTDELASTTDDAARSAFAADALKPGYRPPGKRWYADNTREPIRDETLREGLVNIGAAYARNDLPTTSSKPRYSLNAGLAALFDPALADDELAQRIGDWQRENLNTGVFARVAIRNRGTFGGSLAYADPAAELPACLLALDGEIEATGPKGQRRIKATDFFQGLFETALAPDEIIVEARVPDPGPRTGGAYLKLERKVGDFATAAAADHQHVASLRIAIRIRHPDPSPGDILPWSPARILERNS